MKTEQIILIILGALGIIALVMWMQRSNATLMARLQGQQTGSVFAEKINRSNNETVGGVINGLSNSGTLVAIADMFSSIFGRDSSGGSGSGDYLDNYDAFDTP